MSGLQLGSLAALLARSGDSAVSAPTIPHHLIPTLAEFFDEGLDTRELLAPARVVQGHLRSAALAKVGQPFVGLVLEILAASHVAHPCNEQCLPRIRVCVLRLLTHPVPELKLPDLCLHLRRYTFSDELAHLEPILILFLLQHLGLMSASSNLVLTLKLAVQSKCFMPRAPRGGSGFPGSSTRLVIPRQGFECLLVKLNMFTLNPLR